MLWYKHIYTKCPNIGTVFWATVSIKIQVEDNINEVLRLEKIISLSPLKGSLNVQVLASTAEDDVKCIFASFSKYLCFGVFTVTFLVPFLVSFYDHFSAKHQKWSKNEVKNEPKITQMATVNNPNIYIYMNTLEWKNLN